MLKKITLVVIITLVIAMSFFSCSAALKKTSYSDSIKITETSDEYITRQAAMWLMHQFKSTISIVNHIDTEAGIIKATYVFKTPHMEISDPEIRSNLTITVKRGQMKISFTDAYYESFSEDGEFLGHVSVLTTKETAIEVKNQWIAFTDDMKGSITRLFEFYRTNR